MPFQKSAARRELRFRRPHFESLEDRSLLAPLADIVNVTPDPRASPVAQVVVNFTDSVTGNPTAVTGVDANDFALMRNGTTVALTGVTVSGTGSAYTLHNLTTATTPAGTYALTLVASGSGITDSNGLAIAVNASDAWVIDLTAPAVTDIVDVTPDPRTTAVGNVTITFSEAVIGVSVSDFTLTRNGATVSLVGVPLSGSGNRYMLNLSSVTDTVGNYVLTLVSVNSGITDLAGNPLATNVNASDSWTIDDAGEQNDTLRSAVDFGRLSSPATVGPLALLDGNDWFRFTTNAKGGASDSVSISFQNAAGDLDLELYSVSGQRLRVASGLGNTERISLNGLTAGTYYVRVFGSGGAINPEYFLTIDPPGPLVDDIFEQNDARATASNLGAVTSASTISNLVMLDGHDWFRFKTTVIGASGNFVAINFQNAQGNLNLELFNASGVRIASSNTLKGREQISLAGRAAGTYFVHVVGPRNPSYSLQIAPPSTAAFNIAYQFSGLKAGQIAAFQQAAKKWQSIIIADVPSATYFPPASGSGIAVDDLLIDVRAASIDGVGNVAAGSAPDSFRPGSELPFHGIIVFDTADLASLQAEGLLRGAIEHEIAHVLGFGTIWDAKGLLAGAGTANPQFTGSQAVAAYNSIFGTSATGVPVDNSGIQGTADSHWRESVLENELMTGFIGPGNVNPLSIITVASMADLGYVVNFAAADPYTKPTVVAPILAATNALTGSNAASQSTSPARAQSLRRTAAAVDALAADWTWLMT